MQRIFLFFLMLLCFQIAISFSFAEISTQPEWMKKNGWVPYEDVCATQNNLNNVNNSCREPLMVTPNASLQYWAGELIEFYFDINSNSFTRFKIKITWITDRSPFKCGQIIEIRPDQVMDFKHRSYALKRCY